MKLVILTTETLHHVFFVQEITKYYTVDAVICENNTYSPTFPTHHSFEDKRDAYESQLFFANKKTTLDDISNTFHVDSINSEESIKLIKSMPSDIFLVVGTGKIYENVIQAKKDAIINLHGGDPEEYRGLDSHLWAIYHNDFNNFIITSHILNNELDDGDIILQKRISIVKNMKLHELRSKNIQAAVDITLSTLDMYQRHNQFIYRPQKRKGRYYSFMPTPLKEICLKKFERFTKELA